jgi:hypothetical protein
MSTELQSPPAPSPPHYRAVSIWAVVSVAFALATATMFFHWAMVLFPLLAVYCGCESLRQIERSPEEYTGRPLAKTGIWLGAGLGIAFLGWWIFLRSGVPPGYQPLDYSILEPDLKMKDRVPGAALELTGKNVYVRGYIILPPRGRREGLTKFSICRNSDQCKFGMNLARPEDQIHIELTGDREVNYTSYQIGIGGKFLVPDDRYPQPYYLIQADYIHQ